MPENTTPKPTPDPRGPFVVDTHDLGRRPGSMRTLRRSVPAPAGFGTGLIGVPEGATLDLDLRLESVTEGVLVTGTLTAALAGECGRCLDPIDGTFDADFVELFAYPNSVTDETAEDDEVHRIVDDLIDLEPVVRDAVLLGLPIKPLCQQDCGGLCAECGERLDDLPAGHAHETIDPRWAALRQLAPGGTQTE